MCISSCYMHYTSPPKSLLQPEHSAEDDSASRLPPPPSGAPVEIDASPTSRSAGSLDALSCGIPPESPKTHRKDTHWTRKAASGLAIYTNIHGVCSDLVDVFLAMQRAEFMMMLQELRVKCASLGVLEIISPASVLKRQQIHSYLQSKSSKIKAARGREKLRIFSRPVQLPETIKKVIQYMQLNAETEYRIKIFDRSHAGALRIQIVENEVKVIFYDPNQREGYSKYYFNISDLEKPETQEQLRAMFFARSSLKGTVLSLFCYSSQTSEGALQEWYDDAMFVSFSTKCKEWHKDEPSTEFITKMLKDGHRKAAEAFCLRQFDCDLETKINELSPSSRIIMVTSFAMHPSFIAFFQTFQDLFDFSASAVDGWSAATVAALNGNIEILDALLKTGVDLSAADGNGRTPLSVAHLCGQRRVLEFLADSGIVLKSDEAKKVQPLSMRACFLAATAVVVKREFGFVGKLISKILMFPLSREFKKIWARVYYI